MSFAKQAAELLTSPEADQQREHDHNRWHKYLATGAGLAGLAGAGYLAHKNWGSIAPAINNAFKGTPERAPGLADKLKSVMPSGATATGMVGLPAAAEIRRSLGLATKGDSIAGLVEGSKMAPDKSPMRKQMDDFAKDLATTPPTPGAGAGVTPTTPGGVAPVKSLHSAFEPVMAPGRDNRELVDIHNLGALKRGRPQIAKFTDPNERAMMDPRRLIDKYWSSRRQLGSFQEGLKQISTNPTEHAPLASGLQRTFGAELGDAARLHKRLDGLRNQSFSPKGLAGRVIGNAALGGALGYGVDALTQKATP